jgi:predicted thioesterase
MHLRRASEIFFDEPYRLPDTLVGGGAPPACAMSAAGGGRTVASLTTRHLVAVLESRCVEALRSCLEAGLDIRPTLVRLDYVAPAPRHAALRLTAWVDHVDEASATFSARAHDGESGLCEVTIALSVERAHFAGDCSSPELPMQAAA